MVNLMVMLDEKSEDDNNHQESTSGVRVQNFTAIHLIAVEIVGS